MKVIRPQFSSSNPTALCLQLLHMLRANQVFMEFQCRGVAERGMLPSGLGAIRPDLHQAIERVNSVES